MAGIVAGVAAISAVMAGTAFAATGSGDAAAGDASGNASSQDCAAVLQQFGATSADAFAKSDAARAAIKAAKAPPSG
jgi:hypothetical protein